MSVDRAALLARIRAALRSQSGNLGDDSDITDLPGTAFSEVPQEAYTALAQRLDGTAANGAPVADLFDSAGEDAANRAAVVMLNGLSQGPLAIAQNLAQVLGMSQNRAEVIARNELVGSYRDAQMANYRANSDVVGSWIWSAAVASACICCIDMDGTRHSMDEDLIDHVMGRCEPLPVTKSWDDILAPYGLSAAGIPETNIAESYGNGSDWFERQSADFQRSVLGPAKYEAWSRGDISLEDLVGTRTDGQWGGAVYERSLKELGLDARDYLPTHAHGLGPQGERAVEGARAAIPEPELVRIDLGNGMFTYVDPYENPFSAAPNMAGRDTGWQSIDDVLAGLRGETTAAETAEAEAAAKEATIQVTHDAGSERVMVGIFGHPASETEIGSLVGAQDGAEITITSRGLTMERLETEYHVETSDWEGRYKPLAYMRVKDSEGRYIAARLILREKRTGALVMDNLGIDIPKAAQGQGLGTRIFADQVDGLRAAGFDRIITEAVGNAGTFATHNGYYTWAREGYDGLLSRRARETIQRYIDAKQIPAEWANFTRISELMNADGGTVWWRAHGSAWSGAFDLHDGSYSMRTLNDYLESKGLPTITEATVAPEAAEEAAEPTVTFATDAWHDRLMDRLGNPSDEQFARMVGAQPGDAVRVDKYGQVYVSNDDYMAVRYVLSPNEDGTQGIWLQGYQTPDGAQLPIDEQFAAMLRTQVEAAQESGGPLSYLSMKARSGSTDYEDLLRVGFDAPINKHVLEEARGADLHPAMLPGEFAEKFPGVHTLGQLVADPEGAAWWHENGLNPDLTFDLTPGSADIKTLNDYLRAHGMEEV